MQKHVVCEYINKKQKKKCWCRIEQASTEASCMALATTLHIPRTKGVCGQKTNCICLLSKPPLDIDIYQGKLHHIGDIVEEKRKKNGVCVCGEGRKDSSVRVCAASYMSAAELQIHRGKGVNRF